MRYPDMLAYVATQGAVQPPGGVQGSPAPIAPPHDHPLPRNRTMPNDTTTRPTASPGSRPLHHQYPRQHAPQAAYLEIDTQRQSARWDWNAEVGGAVPAAVWHGLTIRVAVSADVTASALDQLTARVRPLVARVIDGTGRLWDGNNHVGHVNTDARAALAEIANLLRATTHPMDLPAAYQIGISRLPGRPVEAPYGDVLYRDDTTGIWYLATRDEVAALGTMHYAGADGYSRWCSDTPAHPAVRYANDD